MLTSHFIKDIFMNKLVDLQPRIVEKMINDNIVMIDVRRPDEWVRTGVIKNAHLITFFDEFLKTIEKSIKQNHYSKQFKKSEVS